VTANILCVDDDANILSAYKRQLRKQYEIDTAEGGEEGLKSIMARGPYAVIISDLRMPGMDGIQFLSRARERSPDSVRIMLSGNADLTAAIEAVNEGNIFRFLTKPCPPEQLATAIDACVRQYQLVTAEKELLEKTLRGSVKVLSDVLGLVNPIAFGRASRVRRLMKKLATQLGSRRGWEFELAAMLSQVGCVTLPPEILEKTYRGEALFAQEARMFESHPQIGHDLIANIPRLEGVAEIIAFQEKHFNGSGTPEDERKGDAIPLGARALHVALHYDTLISSGKDARHALAEIKDNASLYDPDIVTALETVIKAETRYEARAVRVEELQVDMILDVDVKTSKGLLLVSKGQEATGSLRARLLNFAKTMPIQEPIRVLVPVKEPAEATAVESKPVSLAAV
jgi:response regulator RpfG family c-di-GMP phosphodiesterase